MKCSPTLAIAAALGMSLSARADSITANVTADNHYALYSSADGVISFQGGNETGAAGNPGPYNWSLPEHYEFDAHDALYVAAWSDGSVAQGLLGDFTFSSLGTVLSGDSRWRVYATGVNMGDGDPAPTTGEITGYVSVADAGLLWESPFVGDPNGLEPWGVISGVSADARWMWRTDPDNANPLIGGSSGAQLLIFRLVSNTQIPSPGSAAILILGGAAVLNRRTQFPRRGAITRGIAAQ